MTTSARMIRRTARSRPLELIPKIASMTRGSVVASPVGSEEQPAEQVAQAEEDEDHEGDDDRHPGDHLQDARAVLAHSADPRASAGRSRWAISQMDPVTSTTPSEPASSRASSTAAPASRSVCAA